MVQWTDILFKDGGEELPCVLDVEKEDMRVKVFSHPVPETVNGKGYLIEVYTFSELRLDWQLVAKIGDFDLRTVIRLLLEAAAELYRMRGVERPPKED